MPPDPPHEPVVRTFVISSIDVNLVDVDGELRAHGLDLDDRVDGDPAFACTGAIDSMSAFDGRPGIDNQLTPSLEMIQPGGVNGAVGDAIRRGTMLIVIQVSDIDSFGDDPSVVVHVVTATSTRPGGAPLLDGESLAAGQSFREVERLGTITGEIVDGRLLASTRSFPLSFTVMDAPIVLPLRDVLIEADIHSGAGLERGELGGTLLVSTLRDLAIPTTTREVIEFYVMPDLLPFGPCPELRSEDDCARYGGIDGCSWSGAHCESADPPGTHCEGISAGLGFTATAAVLE